MVDWLFRRRIEAFERAFGYDATYMKDVLAASRAAFLHIARLQGMSGHREDVPVAAWYAAKLVTTLHEDCGPCTQLVADMAVKDGVGPDVVRAVLTGREDVMGEDAALGSRFARAVLARADGADDLRAEIVRRFGRRGLVSLTLGMTVSRLYPTLKYALGHGRTCQAVRLPGVDQPIPIRAAA